MRYRIVTIVSVMVTVMIGAMSIVKIKALDESLIWHKFYVAVLAVFIVVFKMALCVVTPFNAEGRCRSA